jgi:hypothetical protein
MTLPGLPELGGRRHGTVALVRPKSCAGGALAAVGSLPMIAVTRAMSGGCRVARDDAQLRPPCGRVPSATAKCTRRNGDGPDNVAQSWQTSRDREGVADDAQLKGQKSRVWRRIARDTMAQEVGSDRGGAGIATNWRMVGDCVRGANAASRATTSDCGGAVEEVILTGWQHGHERPAQGTAS